MKNISISSLLFKCILTFFLLAYMGIRLSAQTITNYAFAASTGTFTALSTPINPTLTSGDVDDGWFNGIPIGFDFWYMGVHYTTVSASTNGWISLGANITNAQFTPGLTSNGNPRPVIAPLWDDLSIVATTNVSYQTTGAAGSRIFTLQYLNIKWDLSAAGAVSSFQVKLYESTGKVEFVYRSDATAVFCSCSKLV